MGVDEGSYETMWLNILTTDPLLPLNCMYAMAIQEERMKNIIRSKEEKGMVIGFLAQAGTRGRGHNDCKEKSTTCSHCGKSGHDINEWFQIIRYPYCGGIVRRMEEATTERAKDAKEILEKELLYEHIRFKLA